MTKVSYSEGGGGCPSCPLDRGIIFTLLCLSGLIHFFNFLIMSKCSTSGGLDSI